MNLLSAEKSIAVDPALLLCPDCRGTINADLACEQCQRCFEPAQGSYNFLPAALAANKLGEDSVFAPGSAELQKIEGKPWRKLIGRLEIERFDREIMPLLPVGHFLELAGESCWASAIYKSTHPSAVVVASDVSPNALANVAIPTCRMFPHTPDVFAAIDGEVLPFRDATFDCIFIEAAMHHMPNPVQMLTEIKRVLKPGGMFVAVDHAVPPHFRFLFSSIADERAHEHGIQEDLVSFDRWRGYFSAAGIPAESLRVYANPAYTRNPLFALAGQMMAIFPDTLKRSLFPVGLFVVYTKTS